MPNAELKLEQQLLNHLLQEPVVDLVGVVDAYCVGAVSSEGVMWTLFSLAAWKFTGGPLQEQNLTIRKIVSEADIDLHLVRPFEIVHLKVRIAEENAFGTPQALLVAIISEPIQDSTLSAYAMKLQESVTFEDIRFGTFMLDRRANWFEAETRWADVPVRLNLPMDEADSPQTGLAHAYELWDSQQTWNSQILDCAVAQLLSIRNEAWRQQNEEHLNADKFKKRMVPEEIVVYPNGVFEFW